MVSYDVVSLFDNVNIDKVIDFLPHLLKALRNSGRLTGILSSLTDDTIISITTCVLRASYLKHDGRVYQQILGCPMGGTLSVTAAEVYMFIQESIWLSQDKVTKPLFYSQVCTTC